ncbi:IS66 family insertion sequence element accessory protein TnpA [Fluviispira multicolorata]|uniref:Transposase n=1 Tax=Fluviispira multicolorata TaxID=2654512 RepID=A0A833JC03_9BACT|nr:transposase [Fluviispira multicolorata]KAB8028619.1 hypothetical protein GCL57_12940 [Fluviispira multicolorata]
MVLRARCTKKEIQRILVQFTSSGLSKSQFCKKHSLSMASIYKWIKSNKNKEHENFIPVAIKNNNKENKNLSSGTAENIDIKIELPTGFMVKISMTADPKWLSAFIKELQ